MKSIYETQTLYVVANEKGDWWGGNRGPFTDIKWAQKEAERTYRYSKTYQGRVVKMVPLFYDMNTGELLTELPEDLEKKVDMLAGS